MTEEMEQRHLRALLILFFLLLALAGFRVLAAHADNLPYQSHLHVYVTVDNAGGGTKQPSDFVVTVVGSYADPSWFQGSATGTLVSLNPYDTFVPYIVTVHSQPNYIESINAAGDCGPNTIPVGGAVVCQVTEIYNGPVIATSSAVSTASPLNATTPGAPNTGVQNANSSDPMMNMSPDAAGMAPSPSAALSNQPASGQSAAPLGPFTPDNATVVSTSTPDNANAAIPISTTPMTVSNADIEAMLTDLLQKLAIIRDLLVQRLASK